MATPSNKDEARNRISDLVKSFKLNEDNYCSSASKYNETQVRTDFITPLLEAFGWDVYNTGNQPLDLREVIEEATVEVGEEKLSKKPDYELRVSRQRKFFVEAKKPSLNIEAAKSASFQVRRYGFSASLPISVLTNFRQLAIYDCLHPPHEKEEAHVARIKVYSYEEFEEEFDEIYESISRESVFSGLFDQLFGIGTARHGTEQFDDHFLRQVRDWRLRLAHDIASRNKGLSPEHLTFIVQLFLSRIVFLRICEDRDIEKYESLRSLGKKNTFKAFMEVLEAADKFYDSGLFDLMADKKAGVRIGDEVLQQIIEELYYPQSPYTFSVVEAGVLGEIYEVFLGEVIHIDDNGGIQTIEKPEVRESGGVVPTPQFIVNEILDRSLKPLLQGKSPEQLEDFTVADICCGSGVFLLGAYEDLLNHHLQWYIENDDKRGNIYEAGKDQWRLSFREKKKILLQNVRGVDIDSNAVEIAHFSLLLKLIENETAESLKAYVREVKQKVLPPLNNTIKSGNSLIDYDDIPDGSDSDSLIDKINPFTWADEFTDEMNNGGFDVIVGNPPYIRIQNMVNYSPEEVELYRTKSNPYITSANGNFDKYALFLERSLNLAKEDGTVGMIIPHKFMSIAAGESLRKLITDTHCLKSIVHFGAQQVFGAGASNYTCIIVLDKAGRTDFTLERVDDVSKWRYRPSSDVETLSAQRLGFDTWEFSPAAANLVFDKVRAKCSETVGSLADIFVGVQTSNDSIYIFTPSREESDCLILEWAGREWRIEKDILRSCLHDVQLQAYSKPNANKYMIFPYQLKNGKARLIQPDEMQSRFPGTLSYFEARREELERRNITGGPVAEKQWYQFGRSQSLTKFVGEKIILPILSLEPKYAFDDQNIIVTGGGNGPYYLVRPHSGEKIDLLFLLAVLCHPLCEAMIRSRTSVFRGGYYSHGKQYIEHLPVPYADESQRKEIAALVLKAIELSRVIEGASTPQKRLRAERNFVNKKRVIEEKLSLLYGLSGEDVQVVSEVPIPA